MFYLSTGVHVGEFGAFRGLAGKLSVNFRNHRKTVVVDGCVASTGGVNIGCEYLGKSKLGPWRDTNILVEVPAAALFEESFAEDWYLAVKKPLPAPPPRAPALAGDRAVHCSGTGLSTNGTSAPCFS